VITTNLPKSYALAASSSDFVATNQQKTLNSSNQHKTTIPSSITDVRSSKRFVSKNSSTLTGAKAKLVPLQKFCWTYVSNLSADQKVDDILAVLKELDQDASFEVEKPANLNRKPTSSAFIVKAPVHLLPTIRDPDFWPANTYVNKYYSWTKKPGHLKKFDFFKFTLKYKGDTHFFQFSNQFYTCRLL
jgi:hypothetical protein